MLKIVKPLPKNLEIRFRIRTIYQLNYDLIFYKTMTK